MPGFTLSQGDLRQIEAQGLCVEKVAAQILIFQRGVVPVRLNRPCTPGDGIVVIPDADRERYLKAYTDALRRCTLAKFVPASGMASRMFAGWFRLMEGDAAGKELSGVIKNLPKYPFHADLAKAVAKDDKKLKDLLAGHNHAEILSYILTAKGLNYGYLPKALVKFHAGRDESRMAIEEHLVEAALYARDANNYCRIHITVPEGCQREIESCLAAVAGKYESFYGVRYGINLSVQNPSTDTIAVDEENRPFRDDKGKLATRAGGHGALLDNLNAIDSDIIFIKNIDNVVPDRLKHITAYYKKLLAGYLIILQKGIFHHLEQLLIKNSGERECMEAVRFCRQNFPFLGAPDFESLAINDKKGLLIDKLNRPLRVCGVVKNEGEPGGGPFWVEDNGGQSLQIIEGFQVDKNSDKQQAIWASATHFNPVDLVCGVKDYKGDKFDLRSFIDPDAVCISWKSEKGRAIKALELPGLWNGAMALWNTVFVEVPIETFNPVKTVDDLLREQHQPDQI